MELKDFLTVASILTLLCPGLVFVFVYKVVASGRAPEVNKDNIAAYVAVSAIYNVVTSAIGLAPISLTNAHFSFQSIQLVERLYIIFFALILPMFCGLIYAAVDRKRIFYSIARKLGVDPIYPAPTAWDTMVERIIQGEYVIATLKDGTRISGYIDHRANFSTKDECYDMLLSETDPPEGQPEGVTRATWIASGEVSTLEIISERLPAQPAQRLFFRRVPPGENHDEQKAGLSVPIGPSGAG